MGIIVCHHYHFSLCGTPLFNPGRGLLCSRPSPSFFSLLLPSLSPTSLPEKNRATPPPTLGLRHIHFLFAQQHLPLLSLPKRISHLHFHFHFLLLPLKPPPTPSTLTNLGFRLRRDTPPTTKRTCNRSFYPCRRYQTRHQTRLRTRGQRCGCSRTRRNNPNKSLDMSPPLPPFLILLFLSSRQPPLRSLSSSLPS